MIQQLDVVQNNEDVDGNPTGGLIRAKGLAINWQEGPLGRGADRKEPNGAFVETVLHAARTRLAYYQSSKFKSNENATAIRAIDRALAALEARTARREDEGVEGTHEL